MRTLLRHHNHPLARYIIPVVGLLSILVIYILLNSPFLFTYRSRANEEASTSHLLEQNSILSVQLGELPICVSSFSYIPIADKSLQSCFAQFNCIDPSDAAYFTAPHYSCSAQGFGFACSENETRERCAYIDEWVKGAAISCGCPEEVSP